MTGTFTLDCHKNLQKSFVKNVACRMFLVDGIFCTEVAFYVCLLAVLGSQDVFFRTVDCEYKLITKCVMECDINLLNIAVVKLICTYIDTGVHTVYMYKLYMYKT